MNALPRLAAMPLVGVLLAGSAWAVELGMVNTVSGPIPAEKLGYTLVHEHLVQGYPGYQADTIWAVPPEKIIEKDLVMMKAAQAVGVKTILDATPADGGRRPDILAEVSKRSGMNVIMSTGLYAEEGGGPNYWIKYVGGYLGRDIAKDMAELFISEITKGIGDTGIKAGAIKAGVDGERMTDYEKAVHTAAVAAQKATGVPIYTHSNRCGDVLEEADFLLSVGGNPKRISIGHVSDNGCTMDILTSIAKKGFYIGFDRIGIEFMGSIDSQAKSVAELIKLGYGRQILLSHDFIAYFQGRQAPLSPKHAELTKNHSVDTISKRFIPALKAQGVTDEQIQMLIVENPRNWLAAAK